MSIKNYNDHSANERTFLAWVRTSITIAAFGVLIERFDLFLTEIAAVNSGARLPVPRSDFGAVAGLLLIIVAVVMILLAALRFVQTANEIDRPEIVPGTGSRLDIALAGLLALLGVALFFYFYHAVAVQR